MTAKERVVQSISQMPDDATIDEILEELLVQVKIEEGLRQLDSGEGIEHDEVARRMAKWLE
jgi:predicted transcriptional regulator